jgi:hypothetical protein
MRTRREGILVAVPHSEIKCRLTWAIQRTVQTVTQIASAIWPPIRPAADRRR